MQTYLNPKLVPKVQLGGILEAPPVLKVDGRHREGPIGRKLAVVSYGRVEIVELRGA